MTSGPPILFLDLDGTTRKGYDELGHFVNGPGDVEVFPEAVERIREWRARGGVIVGVTNQAGVALGYMTESTHMATTTETNRQCHYLLTVILACIHAPNANCFCRKPSPGLLHRTAAYIETKNNFLPSCRDECLMVGDRPEDEAAALAAGVPFQWARDWREVN